LSRGLYWGTGASVVFLTVYRVLAAHVPPPARAGVERRTARPTATGFSPDAGPSRRPDDRRSGRTAVRGAAQEATE
jgi:hypothetical protein